MKFATFHEDGVTKAGVFTKKGLAAVEDLVDGHGPFRDLRAFLEAGGLRLLENVSLDKVPKEKLRDPAGVRMAAPVLRPPKIIALGRSYREHAEEQNARITDYPLIFAKARTSVIGPGEPIVIPRGVEKLDYEVELCAVIGKAAKKPVGADRIMDFVFGFTIMNDVSARGAQASDKQWYRGKSYRTFAPTGPCVVTTDALDYGNLKLTTTVNGDLRQESSTNRLLYTVPEIIAFISGVHELEAGDLIATGTPAGVGVFRDPPVFLAPGDSVELEIENIGTLVNEVAREK
jgi:2-keto-4-pentenoate hydratase/2-oxohepta-3-ene-1,7-dioic acid hydratase in catechol pathway